MLNFMAGMITYIRDNCEFVGSYVSGNTTQRGPFLNLAPEAKGSSGPQIPYVTIQTFANDSDLAFYSGVGGQYTGKPMLRFQVWDFSNNTAMTNAETLCQKLDLLHRLSLGGGEKIMTIIRRKAPQSIPQPVGKDGRRVYVWYVDYDFTVQRTLENAGA